MFENNTGWANSMWFHQLISALPKKLSVILDGWAFLLAFTAPMWTLTGCEYF